MMGPASAAQILEALGPSCRDTGRRELLLAQLILNGIDFIEFEEITSPPARHVLHVHFLNDLPVGAYGLPGDPTKFHVHGGTRITGIKVTNVAASGSDPKVLDVDVDQQGDFSPYLLSIGWERDNDDIWRYLFTDIDRLFSVAPINFRPGCPVDFDCRPVTDCPPDTLAEPALDYLARDYASFRQMLLDLVAQRNPTWVERNPADVGIALLELFAYEGDHQSYFLDAVANEFSLDTARQRVSAKRHARLVDYQMHDGRNAWTFVHYKVTGAGTIPSGCQLVTHITSPMRFDRKPGVTPTPQPVSPPGTVLNEVTDDDYRTDPALAQVRVFETTAAVTADPLNNELRIHSWGNDECCLARGRISAHVYALDATGTTAVRPPLKPSDYLLLEEIRSPTTGAAADADPTHRQVVRIERISPDPSTSTTGAAADQMHDKLFLAAIDPTTKEPMRVTAPVPLAQTLPLVEVTWRKVDALKFPLCLSAKIDDEVRRISVARGNIGLADHGRTVKAAGGTVSESFTLDPSITGEPSFRLRLSQAPLTMQCANRSDLAGDTREAQPAVTLLTAYRNGVASTWSPVQSLLSSDDFAQNFVVDVDHVGRATLRFGDGEYGESFAGVDRADVTYRVGNGRSGNIGAEGLAHIVFAGPPILEALRNPLPAQDGIDPETIEQVRNYAPAAFRAMQFRAVTEDDYRKAALTINGVAGAVASFRWTGSWYTVFIGIDPVDPDNVVTDLHGVAHLEPKFKQSVFDRLTRYRLAGYDLEIRAARYVPLDLTIQICVKLGYFRGDVAQAVAMVLSSGVMPGGKYGLFNPARLTFGQPVYLSRIYEAIEQVAGVESAVVTKFQRHDRDPAGELASGWLADRSVGNRPAR